MLANELHSYCSMNVSLNEMTAVYEFINHRVNLNGLSRQKEIRYWSIARNFVVGVLISDFNLVAYQDSDYLSCKLSYVMTLVSTVVGLSLQDSCLCPNKIFH